MFLQYRKLEYFKENGNVPDDVAQVHYDYYRDRRRCKLVQIGEVLEGKGNEIEKIFLTLGIDIGTVETMTAIS